jgi:hypothetical protein
MSQVGQLRHYAEERDAPPRRGGTAWTYTPPSQASEYHLIDLFAGVSHGGFETLAGARQSAARRACRRGISSMAMLGSSTTIRDEISPPS